MKNILVMLALVVLVREPQDSQSTDHRYQILEAKRLLVQGNIHSDQSLLLQGRAIIERVHLSAPSSLTLYYLTYAEHELVRYGIGRRDDDLFDRYIGPAIDHAEQLVEQRKDWSEALALLSSLYGMKIAKSWVQAPFLGPKASTLAERAVEKDSSNPRAWLVRGTMKFNTPSFFGGSIEEALASFRQSAKLFDSIPSSDPLHPDWGCLDALAWMGRTYEKLNQLDSALAAYRKALEIEPDFAWVKYVLLPALEKKLGEKQR